MVTRRSYVTLLTIGVFVLLLPVSARAQADTPRASVTATGGVSVVDGAGGTYGGEVTIRLSRIVDVMIGATHLSDITADDFTNAADTIARLVGATSETRAAATVIEGGLRLRLPTTSPFRPYALIGGGVARITTEIAFFKGGATIPPGALGISLGPEFNGQFTKGSGLVGAGVDIVAGRHVAIDAGLRYSGFVAARDESPRYYVFPVLRFQVGAGIRF